MKTELRNQNARNLHEKDTGEILRIINNEDRTVAKAVEQALPDIVLAVDRFVDSYRQGGQIFYVGAGTSGRLGVLDAAEIPPTFGVPEGRVVGEIAGGKEAITSAKEGYEDDNEAEKPGQVKTTSEKWISSTVFPPAAGLRSSSDS